MVPKRPILTVKKRTLTGRKVKKLRKEGLLPATVYGKKAKSVSVEGKLKDFTTTFSKVGETGLVDLSVEGEKEARAVLLKNPQYHPVTDQIIHIDLHQVDLTEKVIVSIPVELIGEALAVKRGEGILVQPLDEIEIEALPTDLPEKFVADASKLEKVGDAITVSDLKIDTKKITLQTSADQVLAKIDPLAEEEAKPAPAVAEPTVGVEGAAEEKPAETGKAKPEEAKPAPGETQAPKDKA